MLEHNIQYLEQRLEKRGWMIVDKQTLSVIVVLYFDALLPHIMYFFIVIISNISHLRILLTVPIHRSEGTSWRVHGFRIRNTFAIETGSRRVGNLSVQYAQCHLVYSHKIPRSLFPPDYASFYRRIPGLPD